MHKSFSVAAKAYARFSVCFGFFGLAAMPAFAQDAWPAARPVFFVGNIANVLLVGNAQPMKNVQDVIKAAKAKPGTLGYGAPSARRCCPMCPRSPRAA